MATAVSRDTEAFLRTLIYIPIIHTEADMGGLAKSVRSAALRRLGLRGLKSKESIIDKIWMEIEQAIGGLDLPYEKVRLYQDGLPVCGREAEIVKELARSESRNHRLLLSLMERGATIMGTESLELLLEEYRLVKDILASGDAFQSEKVEGRKKSQSHSLVKRRDQFIAGCINSTLCAGETGILFLGMLHSLRHLLDKDIHVIYPVSPVFDKRVKVDEQTGRQDSHR
jgi:hypothetical protein